MHRRALITTLIVITLLVSLTGAQPAWASPVVNLYAGQSLQAAVNAATPGETIAVHAGTYSGISITGRTWNTPVVIVGAGDDHVVLDSVSMLDTHGLALRRLDITNQYQARYSSHLEVSDSHVGLGIHVRDGIDDLQILRNRLDGGDFGVWIYNSAVTTRNTNIVISGNDISQQTNDNIQIGAADGLLIENNVIHDIPDNPNHNDGIQLMGTNQATIAGNRFWNQDEAIILKAETYLGPSNQVANVLVENNLSVRERGAGIIVAGTNNVDVVNNTGGDNPYADIDLEASNAGLRLWNNVGHEIWKAGVQSPDLEDYNCGSNIYQHGAHDVMVDPTFVDHVNYQLSDNSACSAAATSTGAPTNDIAGNIRRGPITAGAWQAGSSAASLPAPATNTPTTGGTGSVLPASERAAGYWVARSNGQVNAFGSAAGFPSALLHLNAPIVGITTTPSGQGYWLVGQDGGVFSYGDAPFLGSTGSMALNAQIVGMASAPIGIGYWFVASDGGVFSYGDAGFYGSMGGQHLNQPIVGLAPTPSGKGYWLVAADGGVFAFGDAAYFGSTGSGKLNKPIVAIAAAPDGKGYLFTASDGGVFCFGSSKFYGSTGGISLSRPVTSLSPTPSGNGYWMLGADGGIFAFGDATFQGSAARNDAAPAVGLATPSQ